MNQSSPILVYLWHDLRLSDHPALHASAQTGRPVLPVFIWSPEEEQPWAPGAASRWWLHHSLTALQKDLRAIGSDLLIRRGKTLATLRELIQQTGATSVYFSRRYEPALIQRDESMMHSLANEGIDVQRFESSLLFTAEQLLKRDGTVFKVFTPFWRNLLAKSPPDEPLPRVKKLISPQQWPQSLTMEELSLLPRIHWDEGFYKQWSVGETAAQKRLRWFTQHGIAQYEPLRDRMDLDQTSRLSPHLYFGEISARTIWHTLTSLSRTSEAKFSQSAEAFLRQLAWREFAYSLLLAFPHTTDHPLREEFEHFPWRYDERLLKCWQHGRTGYPIVDAAMQQLWQTGWMHNRARLIVGSFLVKDLRLHWLEGARWFWDTLVDADLANNTLGWQWVAGSGADAAPFFRIFNPDTQARKFDPEGVYVQQWMKQRVAPVVDHNLERRLALLAYQKIKR